MVQCGQLAGLTFNDQDGFVEYDTILRGPPGNLGGRSTHLKYPTSYDLKIEAQTIFIWILRERMVSKG